MLTSDVMAWELQEKTIPISKYEQNKSAMACSNYGDGGMKITALRGITDRNEGQSFLYSMSEWRINEFQKDTSIQPETLQEYPQSHTELQHREKLFSRALHFYSLENFAEM